MSEPASDLPTAPMTVDEFLVWCEGRPGRYDLVDGRLYAMAPERVVHGRVKLATQTALARAIAKAGLPCEALPDGMTVRIDRITAFEPDGLVYCGPRLPGHAVEVPEPVIVVEVLSPKTSGYDKGGKLAGYFSLASLHHYLILDPDRRLVIHHRRDGETIKTRILTTGTLRLDPPSLDIPVASLMDAV